jgi:hypothetical protein
MSLNRLDLTRARSLTLAIVLASSTSCIKSVLIDGQIQSTRKASTALDTIGDYELARTAVRAGIAQFEGMHALAPDNDDALFLLTKSWASYAFAFLQDDLEVAEDAGDDARAEALRASAREAYDRAIEAGLALLSRRAPGFSEARRDAQTLSVWLARTFVEKEDASALVWTGQAWLGRVDLMRGEDDGVTFIAEAWIGATLLERAVALDPGAEHSAGMATLAAYHSSTGYSLLDQGRAMFEKLRAGGERSNLLVEFLYAKTYACVKGDGKLYEALLRDVEKGSGSADQRLQNAVAQRRASRWLSARRAKDVCGIDLPPREPGVSPR